MFNKWVLPLALIILIVPLFSTLIRPGFYPMQDDLQAFRVQQMTKCLVDLQIPCRWIPDMGYQYGYPQFNFYPPSVFYLGGALNLLGVQVIDTVKFLFILGFILSALSMYLLLNSLFGRYPAFVGSMLYSVVPYKATEVYVRGSLSEFFSFVFFPLIFYTSLQLIKLGKLKYAALLAISIALLLTTHNLMSFIFLPLFAVWSAALVILYKEWKSIPKLILGSLLGLGLAAFFTLPVIMEGKYVHLETLTGGYFDWRQHFVSIKQLFLDNNFGYGSSYLGPNDDLSLSVGIVQWVLSLLAILLAALNFKKQKKISLLIFVLGLLTLMSIFLMHQRSTPLWESLPGLYFLQFPWRFLSNSTFLLSVLGAAAIFMLGGINKKLAMGVGIVSIITLYLLHFSFFRPIEWLDISDQQKFSADPWEKQLTISIFDYLPIYAKLPPNKKAPELPDTLEGNVQFLNYQKGSNYQVGEMDVANEALIRLPLFDFPGMAVYMNGNKINHWHDDCRNQEYCLGLITFKLPAGKHNVKAVLENTPIRSLGNIITLVSIFIVAGLFFPKKNYKQSLKF